MRKTSVMAVFAAAMMALVGCGGIEAEEHEFTRSPDEVSAAALASQEMRSFVSDGQTAQVEGQLSASAATGEVMTEAAASCSGACNGTTCICTGDLDCCLVGCTICWAVVDSTLEP